MQGPEKGRIKTIDDVFKDIQYDATPIELIDEKDLVQVFQDKNHEVASTRRNELNSSGLFNSSQRYLLNFDQSIDQNKYSIKDKPSRYTNVKNLKRVKEVKDGKRFKDHKKRKAIIENSDLSME